ncbi:MAG: polyisoprenoid-binding protein [Flavobacteriia bacterium]|nr:polyisoprenoid-binding protein [Flavobacteriia bacterium]NBX38737.1 polyisoprenoid-binding protein [Flavobacteriia bacterium]
MKKIAIVLLAFAAFSFMLLTQGSWTLDAAHSRLGFTAVHMGISDANGAFDKVTCTVTTANDKDFSEASFDLVAEASSLNTGLDARDNHLKSEDFFAVSQYPTIQFKSTSCTKLKGKKYLIKGNLSMHGITKEVSLTATHNGNAKNRAGLDVAGFKITGKFNRLDFGIGKDMPVAVVSDEITLSADLEVIKN